MSNICMYVKKRLVWVFYNKGDRDKANETNLKEGGGIEMSTTVFYNRGERDKANETGLKEGGGIEMSTTVLHSL